MEKKFKVTCGTWNPQEFEVDLDEYGVCKATEVDDDDRQKAFDLLVETMDDLDFANDGHRNDDAVNTMIALHVLGYNARNWLQRFCESQPKDRFWASDLTKFMEHVDRVDGYVRDWGPEGAEEDALLYALWN